MQIPYESAIKTKIRELTLSLVKHCIEYPVLFRVPELDYAPILEIAEELDILLSNDRLGEINNKE